MWLDVIGKLQPAQTSGFGTGDWIALGLVVALLLAAFVLPNVIAGLAIRRWTHHPGTGAHGRTTGTAA